MLHHNEPLRRVTSDCCNIYNIDGWYLYCLVSIGILLKHLTVAIIKSFRIMLVCLCYDSIIVSVPSPLSIPYFHLSLLFFLFSISCSGISIFIGHQPTKQYRTHDVYHSISLSSCARIVSLLFLPSFYHHLSRAAQ